MKIRIDNETYKYVLKLIRNLERYKKERDELKIDIIESSPGMSDGQPRGNQTSDSTASKTIRMDTNKRIHWLENIIETLENIYNRLDNQSKDVWNRVIIKRENPNILEYEIGMSRATIYRTRKYISILCAVELGILKI